MRELKQESAFKNMVDCTFVWENIAVGGAILVDKHYKELRKHYGITHIIDAQAEWDDTPLARFNGIETCWAPAWDDMTNPPVASFRKAVKFIEESIFVDPKAKLLCHCFIPGAVVGDYIPHRIEDEAAFCFDHNGERQPVLSVFHREFKGFIHNIKARGILPLNVTSEHPFYVLKPHRRINGKIIKPTYVMNQRSSTIHTKVLPDWVNAENIETGDFLSCPKLKIPAMEIPDYPGATAHGLAKIIKPLELNDDLAWFFGMYIANGSADKGNGQVEFCVKKSDNIKDRLIKAIQFWNLDYSLETHDNYYLVSFNSVVLARSFREWFGTSSYEKHIPEWLYSWNLREVLRGYCDGDAYEDTRRGSMYFTTTSSWKLAHQLFMVLVTLGECPYMNTYDRETNLDCERAPAWSVGWTVDGGHSENFWWEGKYWVRVESNALEPYEGLVYNREVENSHSYMVNGVGSHNCAGGVHRGPMFGLLAAIRMGVKPHDAILEIEHVRAIADFPDTYRKAVVDFMAKYMRG